MFLENTISRIRRRRGLILPLIFMAMPPAWSWGFSEEMPAPLPPPPELLADIDAAPLYDAIHMANESPEETRQALEPPQPIAIQPARTTSSDPTPAQASRYPETRAAAPAASAPAAAMPSRRLSETYAAFPADAEEMIPGVLLPELDETFREPGFGGLASDRQAAAGLTIRQLQPYFALAKGSESQAIEARKRGDANAFADQASKAIAAYMDIIGMADAGTEAREEAWYGVARCEYRLGNWWRAFDALERSFPGKFEKSEVASRVKLEMFIAERLWRLGDEPAADAGLNGYRAAGRVYAAVVFNQPAGSDAPIALLRQGDAAAMGQDWKEAAKYYRQVVEYYPESEQAMQARSSLTESIYRQDWPAGFPEAARTDVASIMDDVERADSRLSDDAEERRKRAVTLANDLEAETKLRHAKEYLRSFRVRKSRDAAVFLLGDICSLYPNTSQAAEAADMLLAMGIEPPMILSDSSRFPLSSGWSGREPGFAPVSDIGTIRDDGFSGGSVAIEGQNNRYDGVLPPSPTRVTVFETLPEPVPIESVE